MITFFDNEGMILHTLQGSRIAIELNKSMNPNWVDGQWDTDKHYVLNGEPINRPVNPTQMDELTLINLPVPCKILINDNQYDITDSTVELELPMSAKYKIVVKCFPYLDAEFEIET